MSEQILRDKVVVVTGAGRGIGRSICLGLAREGAKVVVNDLGTDIRGEGGEVSPAAEVAEQIRSAGGEAVANHASVAEFDSARTIVGAAIGAFGRIDGVVNNAGILRDGIFHKMTADDWDAVIKVHLYGSFNVSRAAAEHFRKQESGAFLHMTSTSGLIGNFGQANYAAAKMGIVGLSKSLALDMARFNVRSNCIAPFAWSRLVGSIPESPDQQERLARMKRMSVEDIAPLAVFLCSDAANSVTGQVFAVRHNEIALMGQSRPLRTVHRGEGWTPQTVAEHAVPALAPSFYALDRTADVFSWDPV